MTAAPVDARRASAACWEVEASDEWRPHFDTEEQALVYADGSEDGAGDLPVTHLAAPCWLALCGTCGEEIEGDDYGAAHYRTAADAEDVYGVCPGGCEQPDGPGPLRPSPDQMDPIPGFEP